MSILPVARFFVCIYLPLAWAHSALATWRFASFTTFCGLVMASAAVTILIAAMVWVGVLSVSVIGAHLLPRIDRWRWAEGALAFTMTLVFGQITVEWLAGFGIEASRRLVIGMLLAGCAALWFLRPGILRFAIDTITGNAWQIARYPLLVIAAICVCGALAGLINTYLPADPVRGEKREAGSTRSLLLITIDTFSASRSSLYGAPVDTTPFLRSLAARSVVFDMALSASNFTAPGLTSIHTGKYPWTHRIVGQQGHFSEHPVTLATQLAGAGFRTAFFNANWLGDPRHSNSSAGWNHLAGPYQAVPLPRHRLLCANPMCDTARLLMIPPIAGIYTEYEKFQRRFRLRDMVYYPPEHVFDAARDWIARRDDTAPQFVWLHIFGPHDPYLSPSPYLHSIGGEDGFDTLQTLSSAPLYRFSDLPDRQVRLLESRYLEMLRYMDDRLRSFMNDPAVAAFAEKSVVVITSDHGESFERGYLGHAGPLLTQSLIHVPLLIQAPEATPGMRVSEAVSQVDVLPTILEILDVPVPAGSEGVSQRAALQGDRPAIRPIYSMNLEKAYARGHLSQTPWSMAVVEWPWKYVEYSGRPERPPELYDLGNDPREARNLAGERPAEVARLSELIRGRLAQHD